MSDLRCPHLVSEDFSYNRCVLDAGHSGDHQAPPDWLRVVVQQWRELAGQDNKLRAQHEAKEQFNCADWYAGQMSVRIACADDLDTHTLLSTPEEP